jgi:protocatechuate 3,4-dioxygenase beta subunit
MRELHKMKRRSFTSNSRVESAGHLLLGIALLIVSAAPVMAQGTAAINGVVTDEQGAAIPGVAVTLRNAETGVTRVSATEADGRYRFPALAPGRYSVRAELSGFQTLEVQDLILTIGFQHTQTSPSRLPR